MVLKKKPEEKKKPKYFWPKIKDPWAQTPKPKTPKPKTPKPKTPKPKTPKPVRKRVTKKDIELSKILECILPEKETEEANVSEILENIPEVSSCKRALNFVNISVGEFENVGIKDVEKKSLNDSSCDVGNQIEKSGKDQRTWKVYRRRHNSKCLDECRKIGINFLERFKKKRKGVNNLFTKGSRMMLLPMQLKIDGDSFDCIFSLLFSRMKFIKKKKRSAKKLASVRDVAKQTGDLETISLSKTCLERNEVRVNLDQGEIGSDRSLPLALCSVLESKESETNSSSSTSKLAKEKLPNQSESGSDRSLQLALCSVLESKESETNSSCSTSKLAKEKLPKGPTKRKEKQKIRQEKQKLKSCLKKLKAWNGNGNKESMEQIMDHIVEYFKYLSFYEDLDSIERLSIMVRGENNLALVAQRPNEEGDAEKPFEETEEFCEEREILQAKMNRFYMIMTNLQGPKDFVKWNGSVLDSVVGVFLTQNVSDVLSSNAYMEVASRYPIKPQTNENEDCGIDSDISSSQGSTVSTSCSTNGPIIEYPEEEEVEEKDEETKAREKEYDTALKDMIASLPNLQGPGKEKKGEDVKEFDWEPIRLYFLGKNTERSPDTQDSVDWEAVRKAPVKDIAKAIEQRGQHRIIAAKIQRTLNRLVDKHGTMDLEWLRQAPFEVAKAYLLSFYGLGMKSVECLRLLTLGHDAFPVDVNISRVAVRLGWIPLGTLPKDIPFHLLEKYPLEDAIQEFLWSRICNMERKKLYKIHYQLITFGKIFCTKKNPNCRACPFKNECKYYQSVEESARMKHPRLTWTQNKETLRLKKGSKNNKNIQNPFDVKKESSRPLFLASSSNSSPDMSISFPVLNRTFSQKRDRSPIVEFPASPKRVEEPELLDIEDLLNNTNEADEEIIEVDICTQEFKQTVRDQIERESVTPPHSDDLSRLALAITSEDDYIPLPKHINPIRLRTEHQVYELPHNHPLLKDFEPQRGIIPYLLAIWTTPDSDERNGDSLEGCSEKVPGESLTVKGTFLIPVRTAMKESFPLNGTYFQVNEVFADYQTSECPVDVLTSSIWMLPKRTLYCGYSTSSICKGLTTAEIQRCCWQGYVCTRAFDRKSRAPKPLSSRFHNRPKVKGKSQEEEEE
ncbi:hypothetical protein SOVF_003540 [Spinacia oleracea]|nr:hypothetical protein SOVF_003540 [Spinacia oleracea]